MTWLALILFSTCVSAATTVLQKKHLVDNTHHPVTSGAYYQIVAGVSIAVLGVVTNQMHFNSSIYGLIVMFSISILWVLGGILYFWLMKHTEASIVSIIMTSRVVFTTLIARLFLLEYSSTMQFIGMGLILAGVLLTQQYHKKSVRPRSIVLLVITALIFGLGNIADRIATKEMNLFFYISASFLIPGILTLMIMFAREGKKTITQSHVHIYAILIIGILTGMAATAQVAGISVAPTVGQAVFVGQLKTIFVIILAAIFLRERTYLLIKIFASILCTIGLVLLK